jgi:UV DNA damage endonuclease
MARYVLIDHCNYAFYRFFATKIWYSKQTTKRDINLDNDEFIGYLYSQYTSHLQKFSKKIGIPISDMYSIRDCPREEIWRNKYYSSYKSNRDSSSRDAPDDAAGPFIKLMNEKFSSTYAASIRVENAEADDVISVLTKYLTLTGNEVIIVSNDSDFTQLIHHYGSRVKIYAPKGWEEIVCEDPYRDLLVKCFAGDKTDNLQPSFPGCGKKTGEECADAYLKGTIDRRVLDNMSGFLLNCLLVDLTQIPRTICDKIMKVLLEVVPLENLEPVAHMLPHSVQLGLCCIVNELRDLRSPVFCSRKPIIRTVERDGLDAIYSRAIENCKDLVYILKWCGERGIRVFRISSDLFPHKSNKKIEGYTLDFAQKYLTEAGEVARHYGIRLTFHPGQYNVVGTPTESSFESTCRDLDWHAETLDRMCCGPDSVIVVHGGGIYGDKRATKERWIRNFKRLPARVQRRLVLENCEKCFSVRDCIEVARAVQIPVVFDTHHFACYNKLHPAEAAELGSPEDHIADVLSTWVPRGAKPKFHVSEQGSGQIGHHSDFVEVLPEYLLSLDIPIDIMIEAKEKEAAISHLYGRYPDISPEFNKLDRSPYKRSGPRTPSTASTASTRSTPRSTTPRSTTPPITKKFVLRSNKTPPAPPPPPAVSLDVSLDEVTATDDCCAKKPKKKLIILKRRPDKIDTDVAAAPAPPPL